jgi:hypothetical protein
MHTAVKASMGLASDIEPAMTARSPGIAVDHLGDLTTGVVVVGEDQHVGVEFGVEVLHLRRGQVVEGADDTLSGSACAICADIEPRDG